MLLHSSPEYTQKFASTHLTGSNHATIVSHFAALRFASFLQRQRSLSLALCLSFSLPLSLSPLPPSPPPPPSLPLFSTTPPSLASSHFTFP